MWAKYEIKCDSTSTMAVNTDLKASSPLFQVPNPTAGIVWPLNSLNDSALWLVGSIFDWAILVLVFAIVIFVGNTEAVESYIRFTARITQGIIGTLNKCMASCLGDTYWQNS